MINYNDERCFSNGYSRSIEIFIVVRKCLINNGFIISSFSLVLLSVEEKYYGIETLLSLRYSTIE